MRNNYTGNIERALEIAQDERRRTINERDAFNEFITTVNSIELSSPNTGFNKVVSLRSRSQQATTREIQQAYRKSIMNIPHYEEEYNETMPINLEAELGPDIAEAIMNNGPVTPQIQYVVAISATRAEEKRTEFIKTLDIEIDILKKERRTLSAVQDMYSSFLNRQLYTYSLDELHEKYDQIDQKQSMFSNILEDRQTQRQTGHASLQTKSVSDLQSYLYQDMKVTYPILSDTLQLYKELCSCRYRIECWLSRFD